MSSTLSIIAVVLNEAAHLDRWMRSVQNLRIPPGWEVETVLVDGGSTDGTVQTARDLGFGQVLEAAGQPIPVCRNRGVEAARGVWIAFVDGDCELDPGWLEEARPWMERFPGLVAGWPARPPDGDAWVARAWHVHWRGKNPEVAKMRPGDAIEHEAFRLLTTRNLLVSRASWSRLEGFDEALVTGEDTDFVFRASTMGLPVFAIPGLQAVHHGEPQTLGQFFRQQLWHANRVSYRKIFRATGGKVGGNAPRFTLAFAATLACAGLGLALALASGHPLPLILVLPWLALLAVPALLVSARVRDLRHVPALALLYALYGLARTLDLLGLHRAKPSWKATGAASGAGT